jgi:sugar phosphate isomerase/epimerase
MRLEFYKSLWGWEHLPVAEACQDALKRGYDGIETPIGTLLEARAAGYAGKAISLLFPGSTDELSEGLRDSATAVVQKVTVHAAKDWWSNDRASSFFEKAIPILAASGLEVNFETHRGRLLFSPASTRYFLEEFPALHVCADFSHWTAVSESLLQDQDEALELAISRTRHLHARVGHEEGPQVPDPRAEAWRGHTERFLQIWDRVYAAAEQRGDTVLTVDPEFGPPNYLWTDPADGRHLADQHEICDWMKNTLRTRWS